MRQWRICDCGDPRRRLRELWRAGPDADSPDIKPGGKIADEQVFNGWDCTGGNVVAGARMVERAQGDEELRRQRLRPGRADGLRLLALVGGQHPAERHRPAEGRRRRSRGCPKARSSRTTISALSAMAARARRREQPHHYQITVYALDVDKIDARSDGDGRRFRLLRPRPYARQGDADGHVRAEVDRPLSAKGSASHAPARAEQEQTQTPAPRARRRIRTRARRGPPATPRPRRSAARATWRTPPSPPARRSSRRLQPPSRLRRQRRRRTRPARGRTPE